GQEVVDVSHVGAVAASVRCAEGSAEVFDLVVSADGPHSVGRRVLFPDQPMQYAGYIVWRGLADEGSIPYVERFADRVTWAVSESGYCLLYIVPSRAEETRAGQRQVNWVLYENVAGVALPGVLTDARGVVHPTSLPPGRASAAQVAYVHGHARRLFP